MDFSFCGCRLLAQVSGPAYNVYNTWEPDRDILKTKSNVHGSLVAGSVISAYDYTVNNVGQRTNVSTSGSAFTGVSGWTWGYDALGQVTSATHATNAAFNQGYQYDDIGNRKQSSVAAFTTTYTPNSLNQYTSVTSAASVVNPVYDDDGNQLSGANGQAMGQTFVWDGENRLSTVKDAAGNDLVSYSYDHASRRVKRTDATSTTLYVYDGWNCVTEYDVHPSSFTLHTSYLWGTDLSGSLQGAGGVGGLLSVQSLSSSSLVSSVFYPTYDGNGNISEYVDATGTLVAHLEYDAFGNVIASSGNVASFDYRFSTKPQDAVTGWFYYGYRWFDAVTGRWTTRDPIAEKGGVNLYGMVGNDGLSLFDVLGLSKAKKTIDGVTIRIGTETQTFGWNGGAVGGSLNANGVPSISGTVGFSWQSTGPISWGEFKDNPELADGCTWMGDKKMTGKESYDSNDWDYSGTTRTRRVSEKKYWKREACCEVKD